MVCMVTKQQFNYNKCQTTHIENFTLVDFNNLMMILTPLKTSILYKMKEGISTTFTNIFIFQKEKLIQSKKKNNTED